MVENEVAFIKIDGKRYMTIMNDVAKDVFIKNKIPAIGILKKYTNSKFSKIGEHYYEKINNINMCVLAISMPDAERGSPVRSFVVNVLGNYKNLIPITLNKWRVTLDCGHLSMIDETVSKIDHKLIVECFKCGGEKNDGRHK